MYIKVKVFAGAGKEQVSKIKDNVFEIFVKEKAKNNMANKRVIEIIAGELAVPPAHVRIVNGHHSPSKLLAIRD